MKLLRRCSLVSCLWVPLYIYCVQGTFYLYKVQDRDTAVQNRTHFFYVQCFNFFLGSSFSHLFFCFFDE